MNHTMIVDQLRKKGAINLAVFIEDLSRENEALREAVNRNHPPIKCRYCGKHYNSVGHTDEYEHNWIRCKEAMQ